MIFSAKVVFDIDILIDNINIHYIDEGEGQPVLLLHGWGSSVDAWRGIISSLKGVCRFIALDFPGCGQSGMPEAPLTIGDYANLILEFLKAINVENPVMIGHSHGGRVIMKLCGEGLLNPPKIVFVDAAGLKPKKNFKSQIKVRTFKTVKFFLKLPVVKKYTADTLTKARAHFGSSDYNNAPEVMRKTLVNLLNYDLTGIAGNTVKNIKCPTLLIWGDKDTATPLYMAHKLEELIPDTGLCVLKDTGHFSFIQKPYEAVAILKSFLSYTNSN